MCPDRWTMARAGGRLSYLKGPGNARIDCCRSGFNLAQFFHSIFTPLSASLETEVAEVAEFYRPVVIAVDAMFFIYNRRSDSQAV